jgi:hypothetical protein
MPAGAALSIAACVLVCFNQLERARAGRLPVTRSIASTEQLAWSIREHLEGRGLQKPLFRIGEGEPVWGTAAGVLLELDRLGVPFAVEESWMPMFPQAFAANGDEDSEIAVSNEATHLTMMERPGNGFIANNSAAYFDAIAVKKGL